MGLVLAACALVPLQAAGSTGPAGRQAVTTLVPVQVTGVQPGPGLWKVSRAGHVLWILGLTAPLPRSMQWQSQDVAAALSRSQALLEPPGVKLKLDTGFFGKLFLLPSLIGVRDNPDGRTLRQVLDPSDYAHWQVLKRRYIGDSDKIERWRPIFAAHRLYHRALARQGLQGAGTVLFEVHQMADRDHLPRISTTTRIMLEHPRQLVKAFKRSELDDRACFSQTLSHLDSDMQRLGRRASDWAVGDVQALRAAYAHDLRTTCLDAISDAGFFRRQGLADVPERQMQHWLQVTRDTLSGHAVVFAVVPMELLLAPAPAPNYLAALKAAGYQVEAPDGQGVPAPDGPLPAPETRPSAAP